MKPLSAGRFLLLVLLVASAPGVVQAQSVATGRVVNAVTGEALANVQIDVSGTDLTVRTAKDGTYTLRTLPSGEHMVRLRLKGYTDQVEEIIVYDGWTTAIDFELTPLVAMLDALMVDGTRERTARNTIAADEAARARSGADAIGQRLPGVQVLRPGSGVGGATRVLIRGLKSLMPNEPAIYVDGVRMSSGGYAQLDRGIAPGISPLDSIDPETIERIEILRGPATAVRYGLDAADGVILVFTKRGGRR